MTFLTPHKPKAAELELILARWENRWELRQLTRALPRSLIAALVLCLIVGSVGYLQFRLRAEQLALVSAVICAAAILLNLLTTLVFPRSRSEQARHFDLEFNLQERLSTALELMSGRLTTGPEIESRQIADALFHARQIDAKRAIELDFRRRELALLLALSLALALLIALPGIRGEYPDSDAPSPATEAAEEELREIIETVATDSDLSDVDRRDLLDALEIALERLQESDISDEEAFAAMSQLQAQLEETEDQLRDTIDLDQSTLAEAMQALDDFLPPSASDDAPIDFDSLSEALEEMAAGAEEMSAEEAAALAEALQEAGASMEQMNADLSQNLEQMANALNEEALQEMREQMEAAQEQLSQEQSRQQQNQEAMTMLQEQAQQAQEAAEEIARQQAQQQVRLPDGAPADESEQGQRRGNQSASQSPQSAEQGNQPGNMQSQQNRPGTGDESAASRDSRSAGSGAGEGEADNRSLAGGAGEDQGADTANRSTGARQIEYEAIYSPHGISGGGNEEIQLRADPGDQTLGEGDFDDNPLGEARVSYDTVFSDYQNAANRALESDYVPLGLRDVVREYFTSLQPAG